MTTVHVAFGGYGGTHAGAERMAWRTTARLATRGHRMTVVTDSAPPAGLDRDAVRVAPAAEGARPGPGGTPPDLVHAYDLGQPEHVGRALTAARTHRVPFVLTPATDPQLWPDPALGRAACEQASVIYTLTAAEETVLRSAGAPADRMRRIAQAPDLTGSPDGAAFRARHGIAGPMVLFAGRRIATKGYRQFLACAPRVWDRLPDTVFALIGPGGEPERDPAREAIRTDPRVRDLGTVSDQDKFDAMAACDVFALPTTADVFPLVFTEAWACGRPVVTGRFPGVGEVVRDGVDGVIIGPGSDELADVLLALLTDRGRRESMGAAGLLRSRTEFGWDRVADDVAAGYRAALTLRPPAAAGQKERDTG
ncbi:glycosyltransferase family 4 protein [Streptomyces sp. NPDC059248]|uniref:glycosyltransferase family 4 protein n=1 Tax=Streptomyces sp. NPDC059248 TaxID=3346791 RepID=UPI00367ABD76